MPQTHQWSPVHLRSEEAEETIVMKHALRNTTALLRGLAAGNLTDIASLLSGAYAEISSISSWLLGSRQEEQESMQKGSKRIKKQQYFHSSVGSALSEYVRIVFHRPLGGASSPPGLDPCLCCLWIWLLWFSPVDRFKDDATQSTTAEALKDGAAHGATLLARLFARREALQPSSRLACWIWQFGRGNCKGGTEASSDRKMMCDGETYAAMCSLRM